MVQITVTNLAKLTVKERGLIVSTSRNKDYYAVENLEAQFSCRLCR